MNNKVFRIGAKSVTLTDEISKTIEFDDVFIVLINAKKGESFEEGYKRDRVFAITKEDCTILWSKPGFDIAKIKKEPKIILLNNDAPREEYYLVINAISLLFYINPKTGNVIKTEQSK